MLTLRLLLLLALSALGSSYRVVHLTSNLCPKQTVGENKKRIERLLRVSSQLNAHLFVDPPRHFVKGANAKSYWHRFFETRETRNATHFLKSCPFCAKPNVPRISSPSLWNDLRSSCKRKGSFLLVPKKCPFLGSSAQDARKIDNFSCHENATTPSVLLHSRRIVNAAKFLLSATGCSSLKESTECVLVLVEGTPNAQTVLKRARECDFQQDKFSKVLLWLKDDNRWVKRRIRNSLKDGYEKLKESEFVDLHVAFQKRFPELDEHLVELTLHELELWTPTLRVLEDGSITCSAFPRQDPADPPGS